MKLKGSVAIVTGGTGGLGRCICHRLAETGTNVAVVYRHSKDVARDLVCDLQGLGVESQDVQCNVTDPDQVDKLVSKVLHRFGRIDILVNDAAYNKWISFDDLDQMSLEEWNKILNINLTGPMLCIKAVAAVMKHQGSGHIVNISSIAGLSPSGSSIAYAVSKAGLIHLTRCMAVGLAPEVLVNCIAPGYMEGTRGSENLDLFYRARLSEKALLKRPVDKDEVAGQVVALCCTKSITGQTLVMDSGRIFH